MNKTEVAYNRVQVIGEMSSFAFVKFDAYEHKQAFKRWLTIWRCRQTGKGDLVWGQRRKRCKPKGTGGG